MSNNNIVLIAGKSATGKSLSLHGLKDQEGVVYLNCEANKSLPFPSKFKQYTVVDPLQVYQAFETAEAKEDIHTIVIDSLTFLMSMYESAYVINSTNGLKAWGGYAEFFRVLMQQHVAGSSKNVIFTAHTSDVLNESEMVMETLVKVKGSLMSQGIEAFFSNVVSSKKVKLKALEGFENPMLNITEEEELLGIKYVYQTRLTKETVNERIRASLGMWPKEFTYIDNNIQHVLDQINQYYA